MKVSVKRVYDPWSAQDGYRVLVDRLWPRGISKDSARIDLWMKEIAPSTALRQWFNHDVLKWNEFRKRYDAELSGNIQVVRDFYEKVKDEETVTLVYGAKDMEHNQAIVLRDFLRKDDL